MKRSEKHAIAVAKREQYFAEVRRTGLLAQEQARARLEHNRAITERKKAEADANQKETGDGAPEEATSGHASGAEDSEAQSAV